MKVLVTGATGLLGSAICTQLIAGGHQARAIARNMDVADVRSLQKAGVDMVPGDVTDLASLQKASEGVDAVIHSAAMLGRPGSSLDGCYAANVVGTINVLSAAEAVGGPPVVQVLTTTFFDAANGLNERSLLDRLFKNKDPYSLTKRLAYIEGVVRASEGQDVRFMIPGAIYGPSVCLEKGLEPINYNGRILGILKGNTAPQLPLPMPWVTADDCAYVCIAAITKGAKGERYIAHGPDGKGATVADVGNLACELAGLPQRVRQIGLDELDSPEVLEKFGPTSPLLAKNAASAKGTDSTYTQQKLGYKPTSVKDGLLQTLDWMRSAGAL